jgi:hypothetical protein
MESSGRRKENVMTQAEIEAKLQDLSSQFSRLRENQQNRNKRRFWIGGLSLLLALGYIFTAAITSISALGPAGISLLFVGLALYACEMEV